MAVKDRKMAECLKNMELRLVDRVEAIFLISKVGRKLWILIMNMGLGQKFESKNFLKKFSKL